MYIRVYGLKTKAEITSFRESIGGSIMAYKTCKDELNYIEFDTDKSLDVQYLLRSPVENVQVLA